MSASTRTVAAIASILVLSCLLPAIDTRAAAGEEGVAEGPGIRLDSQILGLRAAVDLCNKTPDPGTCIDELAVLVPQLEPASVRVFVTVTTPWEIDPGPFGEWLAQKSTSQVFGIVDAPHPVNPGSSGGIGFASDPMAETEFTGLLDVRGGFTFQNALSGLVRDARVEIASLAILRQSEHVATESWILPAAPLDGLAATECNDADVHHGYLSWLDNTRLGDLVALRTCLDSAYSLQQAQDCQQTVGINGDNPGYDRDDDLSQVLLVTEDLCASSGAQFHWVCEAVFDGATSSLPAEIAEAEQRGLVALWNGIGEEAIDIFDSDSNIWYDMEGDLGVWGLRDGVVAEVYGDPLDDWIDVMLSIPAVVYVRDMKITEKGYSYDFEPADIIEDIVGPQLAFNPNDQVADLAQVHIPQDVFQRGLMGLEPGYLVVETTMQDAISLGNLGTGGNRSLCSTYSSTYFYSYHPVYMVISTGVRLRLQSDPGDLATGAIPGLDQALSVQVIDTSVQMIDFTLDPDDEEWGVLAAGIAAWVEAEYVWDWADRLPSLLVRFAYAMNNHVGNDFDLLDASSPGGLLGIDVANELETFVEADACGRSFTTLDRPDRDQGIVFVLDGYDRDVEANNSTTGNRGKAKWVQLDPDFLSQSAAVEKLIDLNSPSDDRFGENPWTRDDLVTDQLDAIVAEVVEHMAPSIDRDFCDNRWQDIRAADFADCIALCHDPDPSYQYSADDRQRCQDGCSVYLDQVEDAWMDQICAEPDYVYVTETSPNDTVVCAAIRSHIGNNNSWHPTTDNFQLEMREPAHLYVSHDTVHITLPMYVVMDLSVPFHIHATEDDCPAIPVDNEVYEGWDPNDSAWLRTHTPRYDCWETCPGCGDDLEIGGNNTPELICEEPVSMEDVQEDFGFNQAALGTVSATVKVGVNVQYEFPLLEMDRRWEWSSLFWATNAYPDQAPVNDIVANIYLSDDICIEDAVVDIPDWVGFVGKLLDVIPFTDSFLIAYENLLDEIDDNPCDNTVTDLVSSTISGFTSDYLGGDGYYVGSGNREIPFYDPFALHAAEVVGIDAGGNVSPIEEAMCALAALADPNHPHAACASNSQLGDLVLSPAVLRAMYHEDDEFYRWLDTMLSAIHPSDLVMIQRWAILDEWWRDEVCPSLAASGMDCWNTQVVARLDDGSPAWLLFEPESDQCNLGPIDGPEADDQPDYSPLGFINTDDVWNYLLIEDLSLPANHPQWEPGRR